MGQNAVCDRLRPAGPCDSDSAHPRQDAQHGQLRQRVIVFMLCSPVGSSHGRPVMEARQHGHESEGDRSRDKPWSTCPRLRPVAAVKLYVSSAVMTVDAAVICTGLSSWWVWRPKSTACGRLVRGSTLKWPRRRREGAAAAAGGRHVGPPAPLQAPARQRWMLARSWRASCRCPGPSAAGCCGCERPSGPPWLGLGASSW